MTEDEWVDTLINGDPGSLEYSHALEAAAARKAEFLAKGVRPPVGHKIVIHASGKGYEIPQPVTITDARDGPWISLFELAKSRGMIGAQGASPPEPAKGMNGPTGNKGSPGIVGVPTWGCDPGSGEIWITGDNTIAGEVGESQSYVSRDGAALSRAPEIPVTEEKREVVRNVLRSHGLSGDSTWDGVVDGIYRAMRAEEPDLDIIDSLQVSQDALLAERQELIAHAKKIGTLMIERDRAIELLRCSENVRYNLAGRVKELEAGIPAVDTSALLARAEAAEGMILAIESNAGFYQELADRWKNRALAAETRLAERDAPLRLLATRNPTR